jgi:hypothetical protein
MVVTFDFYIENYYFWSQGSEIFSIPRINSLKVVEEWKDLNNLLNQKLLWCNEC